ncbi:MAG: hypothetical protein OQK50_03490 [Deltaproteobacteria bacterium]|jgi:hypothetical protein|nr:hypothetical protein [Deltaproteobacteria bacterium]MCW9049378.1 hypothetical protein [Deltaproteobacteria bacterium]
MCNLKSLLLLASFLLSACLGPVAGGPGLPKTSEGFSESMRWRDYQSAALYLQPEARSVFLEQFKPDEDLHVVDSRILKVDLHEKEGSAEAEYMLEYYRLPSTRIKKWYWTQRWTLIQEKMTKSGAWLIENAPPALPWNQ